MHATQQTALFKSTYVGTYSVTVHNCKPYTGTADTKLIFSMKLKNRVLRLHIGMYEIELCPSSVSTLFHTRIYYTILN